MDPNPLIDTLRKPRKDKQFLAYECCHRMVLLMINEAARCLEEKIVDDPRAVDVGMIMGTGFPPWRGGLLRYADSFGIENIIEALKLFKEKFHAARFEPCGYLLALQENKQTFYSS